jgi:hypothetical protein
MSAAQIAAALDAALMLVGDGRRCFPCFADKRPATPHGFKDAPSDPDTLRNLWWRYPGLLVGLATGAASDIDVLDLDRKHPAALEWWSQNRHHLPSTRVHRTRSRGLHLVFQHRPGMRCWTGRPVLGIDGRTNGGFAIWWPAAGLPVLCEAPPAPWPTWLVDELKPPSTTSRARVPPAAPSGERRGSRYGGTALRHAAERVARAPAGIRNSILNAETFGIVRLVSAGLLDIQEVADTLAAAAVVAGLSLREIQATLRSAIVARGLL